MSDSACIMQGADAGEDVDEEACWPEDGKPRPRARGPAAFTHAALHSAWAWLQVSSSTEPTKHALKPSA